MKVLCPLAQLGVPFCSSTAPKTSRVLEVSKELQASKPKRRKVLHPAVAYNLSTAQDICRSRELMSQNFSFEIILLLEIYKGVYGDLFIKHRFKIPPYSPWPEWSYGFHLGSQVCEIRRMQKKGILSPEVNDALVNLQFVWDYPSTRNAKIQEAIELYMKYVSKDISTIPCRFVVPRVARKWPKSLWGMKLGHYIHSIRNYPDSPLAQALTPVLSNFSFDFSKQRGNFDLLKETLLVYQSIHGNLHVPPDFIVPGNPKKPTKEPHTLSPYPERMHGKCLGGIVHSIRSRGDYKPYKAELLAMGFSYSWTRDQVTLITQAILWYQEQFGQSNSVTSDVNYMKTTFVVPYPPHDIHRHAEETPESDTVSSSRKEEMSESKMRLLLWLSNPITEKHDEGEENAVKLVGKKKKKARLQRRQHRNDKHDDKELTINAPTDSRLWGLQLGRIVWDIRRRRSYRIYEQQWRALGITYVEAVEERSGKKVDKKVDKKGDDKKVVVKKSTKITPQTKKINANKGMKIRQKQTSGNT